jgi:putative CocE/NonD family hydrolase
VTDERSDTVRVIRNTWISMSDGCRLAARIWLPPGSEMTPVPAILEYIPYRKGDLMAPVDAHIGPWFAAHGYAYVRVDLRGAGDSEGVLLDEYLPQEQDDAVEAIAWIADQAWATGDVGMIGFSWGGFNGLQVAARRPPQLKAVISMLSTDDRYADDVHYMGGVLLTRNLTWASLMLAYTALPPDPETVGDAWRAMWFTRLNENAPNVDPWLTHQHRDAYWKHGSVCEDYDAVECPVYMVGGWADGYVNAVLRFVEGHGGVRKGLIGPWAHGWPQDITPGPTIGFLQECLRWWDRWLKGVPNGIDEEPRLRAWIQESYRPGSANEPRPGRWIAEVGWPSSNVRPRTWALGAGVLGPAPDHETELRHVPVLRHGAYAGIWCPHGWAQDLPSDQREEDELSVTFTSEPLDERIELLGRPQVRLDLAVDQPVAFVVARLCDVAPDGTSTLISRGALNLTHRDGHEEPSPMVPGERTRVTIDLNALGQAVPAGHRLRVALSTAYWPWFWPSPEQTTLSVFTGEGSALELPIRPPQDGDADLAPFEPPEQAPGLESVVLEAEPVFRRIVREPAAGTIVTESNGDGNERVHYPDSGLDVSWRYLDRATIHETQPLSAHLRCERMFGLTRGDWRVRVETVSTMTSDAEAFHVDDRLEAYEGDRRVFVKTWSRAFRRDLV